MDRARSPKARRVSSIVIFCKAAPQPMGARFLHTADWQLGKRFRFVPGDAGAMLREQRLKTIERIGRIAVEQSVDFCCVAGDIFEMNTVEDTTLRRTLHILAGIDVPWLLLPGNHDPALAESVWTRMERIGVPANVHLLTTFEPFLLEQLRIAVLPAPLRARHESRDVTAAFNTMQTPEGWIRIGLGHGSVEHRLPDGAETHNPISDQRADEAQLDFLALGDWHGAMQIAPRTWYAGTPEPDRFRDNEPGQVLLVDIEHAGAQPVIYPMPVGFYSWHKISHDLRHPKDVDALEVTLGQLGPDPDRCVVSLTLTGTVDLSERARLEELLQAWNARCCYLTVTDNDLHLSADDEALDDIGRSGFVKSAIAELRAIADDPTHADHPHAMDALQLLYAEYRRSLT